MPWTGVAALQVLRAERDWNWLVRKEEEKLSIRVKVSTCDQSQQLFSGTNHQGIIKVLIKYANKTAELILFCWILANIYELLNSKRGLAVVWTDADNSGNPKLLFRAKYSTWGCNTAHFNWELPICIWKCSCISPKNALEWHRSFFYAA